MAWWQVILTIMGSIVAGLLLGVLLFHLTGRIKVFVRQRFVGKHGVTSLVEERRREIASLIERQRRKLASAAEEQHETDSGIGEQKHEKEAVGMVPLFSRWSVITLAIGLIVGGGLGIVYWAMSPQIGGFRIGWPPVVAAETPTEPLYTSAVHIGITNRGTSYVYLKDLQRLGEYYAAKMNSIPFLEFLSQQVAEKAPQYSHSAYELAQIMRIRYDYTSDSPSIEIKATTNNNQEAVFLVGATASAIQEYLDMEEQRIRLQEHQDKLKEWESVRAALIEAEKDVARLAPQPYPHNLELDPDYISLSAKVRALQVELDNRAEQLAVLIAEGDTDDAYTDAVKAMERASIALGQAKSELSGMEAETVVELTPEQKLAYMSAQTKAGELSDQLDSLTQTLASWSADSAETPAMIAFYSIGEPTIPAEVPPERVRGRNALMMGAVLGIGGAWLVLNRRWLANGMPSSSTAAEEEEEEE